MLEADNRNLSAKTESFAKSKDYLNYEEQSFQPQEISHASFLSPFSSILSDGVQMTSQPLN
jgi:hypothetical protein